MPITPKSSAIKPRQTNIDMPKAPAPPSDSSDPAASVPPPSPAHNRSTTQSPRPPLTCKIDPSAERFGVPLSRFLRLPINAEKQVYVGLVIIGNSGKGEYSPINTALLSPADIPQLEVPTGLLVRPTLPLALHSTTPSTSPTSPGGSSGELPGGWDLPSLPALLGVDETLLDTLQRCARRITGREVKEVVKYLGVREYTQDGKGVVGGIAQHASSNGKGKVAGVARGKSATQPSGNERRARQYDFLVKLYPGNTVLPEGMEWRWAGTEEMWSVMKRHQRGSGIAKERGLSKQ